MADSASIPSWVMGRWLARGFSGMIGAPMTISRKGPLAIRRVVMIRGLSDPHLL